MSRPESGASAPAELARLLDAPARVTFTTDAGELILELDPAVAPVAATRIAELAERGWFDGKIVHRVVPGFVAQLGAPDADGWGGAEGAPSIACETAPAPYDRYVAGMALAGRDTGSSQFFVTLARHPHLDGGYPVIGRASGPWDALAEGDVVTSAKVAR
jgi:cyclophilin family peptidyl-prolyl cis-trans isomerase